MHILINVLMLLVILSYFNYISLKKMNINMNKFDGKFFNIIYLLSYTFPLKCFLVEKDKLRKNERKIQEKIVKFNLSEKFNLRSFMALRFLLLFISMGLFFAVMFAMKSLKGDSFNILKNINFVIICLLIPYTPNIYLKLQERKYKNFHYDEVAILQLFMILLIKSNSTVESILFAFSKMNTFYKRTFEKAYRISLRNKQEALKYLEEKFENIIFGNSFNVLSNMFEFSREDSVRILEANLKRIEEESVSRRRKEELSKFSYSQVSVIIPFSIVIFLGAIPIIHYGVNVMINAIQGI